MISIIGFFWNITWTVSRNQSSFKPNVEHFEYPIIISITGQNYAYQLWTLLEMSHDAVK